MKERERERKREREGERERGSSTASKRERPGAVREMRNPPAVNQQGLPDAAASRSSRC